MVIAAALAVSGRKPWILTEIPYLHKCFLLYGRKMAGLVESLRIPRAREKH
jgi:hypothetical protein